MDVRERFEQAQTGFPLPPPQDAREVFRRGRGRRHRRVAVTGGMAVVTVLAVVIGIGPGSDPELPEIAERPDATVLEERAPEAGAVSEHWPIELIYQRFEGRSERFRGNSWQDWSVEVEIDGEFELHDREHPSGFFETLDGAFYEREPEAEDFTRAPGPHLISSWRNTTGLGDRVVVPVAQIPGGLELIADVGLSADQVEAYVTPNVVGCSESLGVCLADGEMGARGIAHLPTGFPLYAEEGRSGERTTVWIEAISIRWADANIEPVPIDGIPFNDATIGAETSIFTDTWMRPDGDPAEDQDSFEVTSQTGPSHCNWEEAVLLAMAWPPGTSVGRVGDDSEVRYYVRDPQGVIDQSFARDLRVEAVLPDNATFTGYRTRELELWLGADDGAEGVFIVRDNATEWWPQGHPGCR